MTVSVISKMNEDMLFCSQLCPQGGNKLYPQGGNKHFMDVILGID